jgi:hypothetical protein
MFFDIHDTKGQKDRFCPGKIIVSIGRLSGLLWPLGVTRVLADASVGMPKAPVTHQVSEQPSSRVQEEEFAKQLRLAC